MDAANVVSFCSLFGVDGGPFNDVKVRLPFVQLLRNDNLLLDRLQQLGVRLHHMYKR